MRLKNHTEYACFDYEQSKSGIYKLGDVVINRENEIGVIIQIQSDYDFRTDMFGNCSIREIRLATGLEISDYRPNILTENTF